MVKNDYEQFDKFLNDSIKNCWNIPGIAISIFDDKEIKDIRLIIWNGTKVIKIKETVLCCVFIFFFENHFFK